MLFSDRLRELSRHQHRQYSRSVANASCNCHQCFRYGDVLLRQSLKTSAHVVQLIDFVQNRFKSHWVHRSLKKPKREELQMDWLRTEDLKEEKVVTTPIAIVSVLIVENNVEK